jgi:hypothetical protein
MAARRSTKHGLSHTRAYKCWHGMLARCFDPRNKDYLDYGGRGITVCENWRESFLAFYADMGDPPDGLTLNRFNNDGSYELSNCGWATRVEQAANRRPPQHSKRRRKRSSSAALQAYVAAVSREAQS